ncbi:MAG: hypothetical protein AB7D28_00760 [Candidatus Berkiella sp.]
MFNDWFYKNVTESALTYIPSNFENIPKNGVIEYSIRKLNETAVEVVQPDCPSQIVDCSDLNVVHNISYAADNCISMSFQCGHEVKQVFSMDEVMALPSSMSKVAEEGLGDLMQVTTQYGDQLSQIWLEWQGAAIRTIPDADTVTGVAKSFFESINPVNLYRQSIQAVSQQYAAGWADYIGGFFRASTPEITAIPLQEEGTASLLNPANLASKLINFANSYFAEDVPEKVACAWDDLSCHQEALNEAMQACSNEEKLGYLQCALSTLQQYVSEYDINEVLEDMQENYLPSAAVTGTAVAAIAGIVIAATAIRRYNRNKAAQ